MTINYIHTEDIHNTNAAKEVLPYLFNLLCPRSVVDIGCGTGSWLKIAKEFGAEQILGIDGVEIEKTMLCIDVKEFLKHDLTRTIDLHQKFDLAICLEVAEHLPENAADTIINTLVQSSEVILFAAAIPGQGGQEHINEQLPSYWQEKFRQREFYPVDILREQFWENDRVEWWYRQNMRLYVTDRIVKKFNLPVNLQIPHYIHPELLKLKVQMLNHSERANGYLEQLVNKEINHPSFLPTLKRLIKSLIR